MFSVLILTLNEEKNLPACLASASDSDDIVVLDSGSTDRTQQIARDFGARVFVRPFDDFAGQRNHAQRAIPFKNPLVFHLDADERMTPELVRECLAVAAADQGELDGWLVAPRMLWQGTWLPHCTDFPAWQARLVRAPRFNFIQVGHGQREAPSMRLGRLRANYLHEMCPAGSVPAWLNKHRHYAQAEARTLQSSDQANAFSFRALFSRAALTRRRALKQASAILPFRPLFRFLYQYILKRGFLDGRQALRYCLLLSRYEGFISEELRKQRKNGTRP